MVASLNHVTIERTMALADWHFAHKRLDTFQLNTAHDLLEGAVALGESEAVYHLVIGALIYQQLDLRQGKPVHALGRLMAL